MIHHIKLLLKIFKIAFKELFSKKPFRESAVIAYYSIFSLPGLLVIVITLTGSFLGKETVSNYIITEITSTFGNETAEEIQNIIIKTTESKKSLLATIFSIATIIIGATGVFSAFQKSLNIIWEVEPNKSKSVIWHIFRMRLASFGIIILISFILIFSLVITLLLATFRKWLSMYFSDAFLSNFNILSTIITIFILAILFAMMFKLLPDVKIKWRDVWLGSFLTSLLFESGKRILAIYFGALNPGLTYGAAGSVILIMLWVSYTSMIIFYGAEFTRAFSDVYSNNIVPKKYAHRVVKKIASENN